LEPLENALARTPFVGLDLSLENLRLQRHTKHCVVADGNWLPFEDESFLLITANMVIEHLKEPEVTFGEMNRVLSPGGTILLHTPNLVNYQVLANQLASAVLPRKLHAALVGTSERRKEAEIYPAFYRANTVRKLAKLADKIGEMTVEFLPAPRPFFNYFAPIALMELLMTRLAQVGPLRRFGSTLLVSIHKPGIAPFQGPADPAGVLQASAEVEMVGAA
jgi:SAM-dependent methyltransferase